MNRVFESDIREFVQQAHLHPHIDVKVLIAIAGNGIDGISELMRYGNGSNTLIGQHLLYREQMTYDYLGYAKGRKPEKLVSDRVARELAVSAYREAFKLAKVGERVAGIGCTSALVKPEGERLGRPHTIHIGVHTQTMTKTVEVTLVHGRSRPDEEWVNGAAILAEVLALRGHAREAMIVWDRVSYPGDCVRKDFVDFQDTEHLSITEVAHGFQDLTFICKGRVEPVLSGPFACFPGSFNPIHDGHLKMAAIASQRLGMQMVFEMCVKPYDKPPLDYIEIRRRLGQFERGFPVLLTCTSPFREKARWLPNESVFVVGMDTMSRILDPVYYGPEEGDIWKLFDKFAEGRHRFLVFCRKEKDGSVKRLKDLPIDVSKFATEVPPEEFLLDVSSTDMRVKACV